MFSSTSVPDFPEDPNSIIDRLEKCHNHVVELLDIPFLNAYAISELNKFDDFLINVNKTIMLEILHRVPTYLDNLSRIAPPNLTHIGDPDLYDKFKRVAQIYDETLHRVISDIDGLLPTMERLSNHAPLREYRGLFSNFYYAMMNLRQYLTTNAEDV